MRSARAQLQRSPIETSGETSRSKSKGREVTPALWCLSSAPMVRLNTDPRPQTKLTVSTPEDHYEQEADRVAEQVMRMPDPGIRLQRECGDGGSTRSVESFRQRASPAVQFQRLPLPISDSSPATAPLSVDSVLGSSGLRLDPATRAFMEPRFGQDFSDVRVHADARAAASAREIGALAFTVGSDIVFGSQYAPATVPGKRLLAHELAHVVQQRGQVMRRIQRQPIHMESGRFVGQIGGTENNNRDEVLEAMDRLAEMNAYPSSTVYQNERTAVAALPTVGQVSAAAMPATLNAITACGTPDLDIASARFLGLTLASSVGQGMPNASDDILKLQDMLHVNWHITNLEYSTERTAAVPTNTTRVVPDSSIPRTIAGIPKLKRAYVGGLHTVAYRRQLGVLDSALGSVGHLNWVPFDSGAAVNAPARLQSDFGRWALIPGEPEPNSVSGRINCWEMILLSAFRAGFLTLPRIRQIYSRAVENIRQGRATRVGTTVESELKGGRQERILDIGNPNSPQPLAGNMVIFNTAVNHAAISLGTVTGAGEHEVLSLFNRPNAISQVQRTTIEALIAANPGQTSIPVRFWGVSW